ncbi:hypothetical protein AMATHDRAFT_46012 [Amanita thiersii Skay4041]|uniref:Uncharacterized protein n=1 Tax=Amanita thiersii Skay4041 TaxID=703135 RepID=A0A2A9NWQ0_9AGAR|nr:hypothetical protein AMATHDRAFT_46012 [Amanita thiersii Skay4041]
MRRFVKALAFKREKPDDLKSLPDVSPHSTSDTPTKKNRKQPHSLRIKSHPSFMASRQASTTSPLSSSPSTPQLSLSGDHPHSSAASSSAGSVSASLQTPDDDNLGISHTQVKSKAWNFWLVNKRATSVTSKDSKDTSISKEWHEPLLPSPDVMHSSLPTFLQSDTKGRIKAGALDDAFASEVATSIVDTETRQTTRPLSPALAKQHLRALINNKLHPPSVSYPFASHPSAPIFPRSCNKCTDLGRKRSIRYILFQRRLLRHLDKTKSDDLSILPLSERPRLPLKHPLPAALPLDDIELPSKTMQVNPVSSGLRRWVSRPCFEDRYVVYSPSGDDIVSQSVTGPPLGVAEIEYSEALDVMAGVEFSDADLVNDSVQPAIPPVSLSHPIVQVSAESALSRQVTSSNSNALSCMFIEMFISKSLMATNVASILVRSHNHSVVPSPLRNDVMLEDNKNPNESPMVDSSVQGGSSAKRGVRFVDDDDDALPLYIVRMKRKREEKAKFLRNEQRRREVEARKALQQETQMRLKRETEQMERERELQEKKSKEEERRRQLYLDQVAATRVRRETQRAGGSNRSKDPLLSTSLSTSLYDLEHPTLPREARYRSSTIHEPPSNPRRDASDASATPHDSSSGSSRPPSISGQFAIKGDSKSSPNRPASMYSTHTLSSSEDINKARIRRDPTMTPGLHTRPTTDRSSSFPMWTSNFLVPPVPPISPYVIPMDPSFAMDMPLLPPAAPFMMQQYSRRSSRQSSTGHSNSSSSRVATSVNSSSERIDYLLPSTSRLGHSSPSSPSSSPRSSGFISPDSLRRSSVSSVEARHSSHSSLPTKTTRVDRHGAMSPSHSQPQISRGRSYTASTHPQLPNPWTALPSQTGRPPAAMPTSRPEQHGHHSSNSVSSRKQTFIL